MESLKAETEELGKTLKELISHQREIEGIASKNIQRSQQLKVLIIIPEHKTFICIQDVHLMLDLEWGSLFIPPATPPPNLPVWAWQLSLALALKKLECSSAQFKVIAV